VVAASLVGGTAFSENANQTAAHPGGTEVGHFCRHGIGAGFRLPRISDNLFGPHPKVYNVAIPLSTLAALIAAAISVPHLISLCPDVDPDLERRAHLTRIVAAVPVVIAVFKMAAVVMPRMWKTLFLVAAIYEVVAFGAFMKLIMNLLAGHDGWTDQEVLAKFARASPVKIWAVPPLGCCFKPLMREKHLGKRNMTILRVMMWQFVVICPLVAAAEMSEYFEEHEKTMSKFETLSLIIAMYALFQLLEATHEMLHDKHCHSKFWTIKGTFIANTAIFRLGHAIFTEDVRIGDECYTGGAVAAAWSGMITATLAVPLALLSRHAYRREDLVHDGKEDLDEEEDGEIGDSDGEPSSSSASEADA